MNNTSFCCLLFMSIYTNNYYHCFSSCSNIFVFFQIMIFYKETNIMIHGYECMVALYSFLLCARSSSLIRWNGPRWKWYLLLQFACGCIIKEGHILGVKCIFSIKAKETTILLILNKKEFHLFQFISIVSWNIDDYLGWTQNQS